MPEAPRVSVVVLSHARPSLIGRALESVVQQSLADREVLVVDNRSGASEEIARIVNGFPDVRLIAAPRNLGFTGGMNLGIRSARGSFVLLTEDDIALPSGCLATFSDHLARHPETGMVTGLVVEENDGTILYAGGDVELGSIWSMRVTGRGEADRGQYLGAVEVGYAPGCTLMAPRELLQRLGGFREDFFLYYEDTDLALRIRRMGKRIECLRHVRVLHKQVPSPGDTNLVEFHKIKNLRALYLLHAEARVLPAFCLRYGLLELLRDLVSNPWRFWIGLKARLWLLANLPRLSGDRFRQGAGSRQG